jgi:hypothetical protein
VTEWVTWQNEWGFNDTYWHQSSWAIVSAFFLQEQININHRNLRQDKQNKLICKLMHRLYAWKWQIMNMLSFNKHNRHYEYANADYANSWITQNVILVMNIEYATNSICKLCSYANSWFGISINMYIIQWICECRCYLYKEVY